ncbi:MAG: FKBP-type peptidyl-prolyl cis-trans isomerase [Verrucomicrobia bacterium]|nr:FKBP-type peptidyl-prolyl cis-trans isomerase [Verrucomicrobiota bacterium]
MKHNLLIPALAVALAATAVAADKKAPETKPAAAPTAFKSDAEKAGYALGVNIGSNLHRQGLDPDLLNPDAFAHGFRDALAGGKPQLTEQEIGETLKALQQTVMDKRKAAGAKAKADGEKFLADNKAKSGVTTLPSGLQYKILTAGKGASPKADDTVTVNYRGTLIDGSEFDSSYKRGQPATFRVGGVIKGWTEALQLMSPGAKWQLVIPASLAYGERGTPGIPPDSTLIFEVELLSFTAPPPAPTPQPITSDIIRVPSAEEMKRGAKIETIKADQVQQFTNKAAGK